MHNLVVHVELNPIEISWRWANTAVTSNSIVFQISNVESRTKEKTAKYCPVVSSQHASHAIGEEANYRATCTMLDSSIDVGSDEGVECVLHGET